MKILLPKVLLFSVFGHSQSIIVNGLGAPKSKIYIFDCFKKLVKLKNPNDFRWDSIFGGNSLFLSVVYFISEYSLIGIQENKEHIALKR